MKRSRRRWSVRGLLVFAIEVMALASLGLRDLPLAAMLQCLAVLVLSVHQLDRSLPSGVERAGAPSESRACRSFSEVDGESSSEN
jgi:hypothetical protein